MSGPADTLTAAERREIATASLTLAGAVGVFGVVFGVGFVAVGGSVLQACVMSLLVFTGASQFSAVSVIGSGGAAAAALGGASILAARNAVYGLAMSRMIGGSLGRRLVAAQLTIDESTAMATAQDRPVRPPLRLLGHRPGGLCLLEHGDAGRRARRLGDRSQDVRARRGLSGRLRGDGRAAPASPSGL